MVGKMCLAGARPGSIGTACAPISIGGYVQGTLTDGHLRAKPHVAPNESHGWKRARFFAALTKTTLGQAFL